MFGIGAGELFIVAVVLLIAVGPKSMPKLVKSIGKALREFRRASRDLRQASGIDDMMRQEELKELRELRKLGAETLHDPLGLKKPQTYAKQPALRDEIDKSDLAREYPPEGVDLWHAAFMSKPGMKQRLDQD